MKCSYCNANAVFYAEHFGKYFCKKHFKNYIEKRLRKYIFKYRTISRNDKIFVDGKCSIAKKGAILALKNVTKRFNVEIVDEKTKANKVIKAKFLEDIAEEIIKNIINKKAEKTERNIFSLFSYKEFATYYLLFNKYEEKGNNEGIKEILVKYFSTGSLINFLRVEDFALAKPENLQNNEQKIQVKR